MSQFLTLSRAARLIGVSRGALQKRIRAGDLPTFEGKVSPSDLLIAYPKTKLEDNTILERIISIKDNAFGKRVRERILPSADVLMARITQLGKEHQKTRER